MFIAERYRYRYEASSCSTAILVPTQHTGIVILINHSPITWYWHSKMQTDHQPLGKSLWQPKLWLGNLKLSVIN